MHSSLDFRPFGVILHVHLLEFHTKFVQQDLSLECGGHSALVISVVRPACEELYLTDMKILFFEF